MKTTEIKNRIEYLRGEIKAERISYGEIAELQSLSKYIDKGDVELLQWAGVPETEATEVKFYLESGGLKVFAAFPKEYYNLQLYGKGMITCYARIGQHSCCSKEYLKGKRKAKPEQYAALKTELESIGYNLNIK